MAKGSHSDTGMIDGIAYRFFPSSEAPAGDPIALLAGYSASSASWTEHFPRLLLRFGPVIAIDNRGTGSSAPVVPGRAGDVADFAKDTIGVLDALGYERYRLLGHSFGGCIALRVAHEIPSRVRDLTVVSSTGGGALYASPQPELLQQLALPPGESLHERTMVIWRLCLSDEAIRKHQVEIERQFALTSSQPVSGAALRTQLQAYRSFEVAKLSIPRIPIAFVHGRSDRLTPAENSIRLHQYFSGSRLHLLEDCEHVPHLERPEVVAEILGLRE